MSFARTMALANRIIHQQGVRNAPLPVFDADSFAVFKRVPPVANQAILDREDGAQRIDAIIIALSDDSVNDDERLPRLLRMEEEAIGIIHARHFHDVRVCD